MPGKPAPPGTGPALTLAAGAPLLLAKGVLAFKDGVQPGSDDGLELQNLAGGPLAPSIWNRKSCPSIPSITGVNAPPELDARPFHCGFWPGCWFGFASGGPQGPEEREPSAEQSSQ